MLRRLGCTDADRESTDLFMIIERFRDNDIARWRGFGATLEIVPVVGSKETREGVAPYLEQP